MNLCHNIIVAIQFVIIFKIFLVFFSIAFPLPELTASGCRVTFHKILSDDVGAFDIRVIVKYLLMLGEIRILEEPAFAGDLVLFDVSGAKASIISKLINPVVKRGVSCSQVSTTFHYHYQ